MTRTCLHCMLFAAMRWFHCFKSHATLSYGSASFIYLRLTAAALETRRVRHPLSPRYNRLAT